MGRYRKRPGSSLSVEDEWEKKNHGKKCLMVFLLLCINIRTWKLFKIFIIFLRIKLINGQCFSLSFIQNQESIDVPSPFSKSQSCRALIEDINDGRVLQWIYLQSFTEGTYCCLGSWFYIILDKRRKSWLWFSSFNFHLLS